MSRRGNGMARRLGRASRSGFTLTELLIVIGFAGALLTIATGMLHRTMRWSSTSTAVADEHRAIGRLVRQLRYDIVRADSVEFPSAVEIEIRWPDRTRIVYRRDSPHCQRRRYRDGEETHHETYRFRRGADVAFESIAGGRRVRMTLWRGDPQTPGRMALPPESDPAGPVGRRPISLVVEATVGTFLSGDYRREDNG